MNKILRINEGRFRANFEALARIGATGDGGVHRTTFSSAHLQARVWFQEQAKAAQLDFHIDGAGNHSAILRCGPAGAPTLLLGSHLDSVPHGGRFDGALGVVVALEVLQTVQDAELRLPFHLEAIDFTDEEGTLVGLLGSTALAGNLTAGDLLEPRGGRQAFLDGLKSANLTETGLLEASREPHALAGYLELHIEQGGRLAESKVEIGIVTNIVGLGSYKLAFIGNVNHAGTTSMQSRRDAAQGASAFTLGVRELVMNQFPECVANIGYMQFEPGAFNIIPGRVTVSLEYRAPEPDIFDRLEKALLDLAQQQAKHYALGLEIEFLGKHLPTKMNKELQRSFTRAAETLGLSAIPLASGAGHDTQSLANVCPAAMAFVPSKDGISHSPHEFTKWQDCINGANILLQATLDWAKCFG